MSDNPLKATVDAIAEGDNEIGGQRITRLTEAHVYGGDAGFTEAASADSLQSKVDVFTADHVGRLVDLLNVSSPGTYRIATYVNAQEVQLTDLTGAAAVFTDQENIRWRFSDLLVESTYEWPDRDRRLEVWVGDEPESIPYCGVQIALNDCRLEGIGAQKMGVLGVIDAATPTVFDTGEADTIEASDVGKALWILPADGASTGNAGPYRIDSVTDDHTVVVDGAGFVSDETNVYWRIKTYEESGYLTRTQNELAEVIDNTLTNSAIGRLNRSQKVELAQDEELDRIARRGGLTGRPRGLLDEIWRRVIMAIMFSAKTTIEAFEQLLTALYPLKNFEIFENLTDNPGELFLKIPWAQPGDDPEGRTFLYGTESQTSTTATSITVDSEPEAVVGVFNQPLEIVADMASLPSADSPAWSYVGQSEGTEGNVFNVASGRLIHEQNGTDDGGLYQISVSIPRPDSWEFIALLRPDTVTTLNGHPWVLRVQDGEREICLATNQTEAILCNSAYSALATKAVSVPTGAWSVLRLSRKNNVLYGSVNGVRLEINASAAGASGAKTVAFGHLADGNAQDFTVDWDTAYFNHESTRNYWNVHRTNGTLANPNSLTDATNPFLIGDTGKQVFINSTKNKNHGVWSATYSAAGAVTLAGIERAVAAVSGSNSDPSGARVQLDDAYFSHRDVGKDLVITGSAVSNNGTYEILAVITPDLVVVDNATGFTTEINITGTLAADFDAESSVVWELIDACGFSGTTLTLRDALDQANQPVSVQYIKEFSGQVLLNESVQNLGSISSAPNIFYPFYLLDVDSATRDLCEEIKAAGVKINYDRL